MAMLKQYNSSFGEVFPDAYWRIFSSRLDTPSKDTNAYRFLLCYEVYTRESARMNNESPITVEMVSEVFSSESQVPFSRADMYNWLKTQPGFEGAIDV